ncbi:sugar transferase [Luteolibacter marinus]|uniref:sugar transferase n=1 Tax=Luteolibacter marinus TaxID=2776705 RepID=UPI001866C970|nr:sugar transferase [Luteolibacter marinus]
MKLQPKERRSRPATAHRSERPSLPKSRKATNPNQVLQLPGIGRKANLGQLWKDEEYCQPEIPGWKRWFDTSMVILSLTFSIPLMLVVGIWIRMVSRGPALYRQKRVGLGGRVFTLYKFRTMHEGAELLSHQLHVSRLVESGEPMMKLDLLGDPRLIAGGCFLRATGLDELPQLLNILRGEMSLVGPRPCLLDEFRLFSSSQRERFKVLPGLSGLWQVNGKNSTTFREMNDLDVRYARSSAPGLDLRILLATPRALYGQIRQCMLRRIRMNHSDRREFLGYKKCPVENRL